MNLKKNSKRRILSWSFAVIHFQSLEKSGFIEKIYFSMEFYVKNFKIAPFLSLFKLLTWALF